ncbi:MAG: SDR family NAD(P)-dependent oxidoreductase, partial [Bdellovibrionales bacterium]|nr:SDR family NAD(P)-dependent oxidoreductase [Bdellovibrionales bacterium]
MTNKVLVTGACGFIGSHLVELLVEQNFNVRALVQYNSQGKKGWLENLSSDVLNKVEIIHGDIRDPYQMIEISNGVESILHLAALIAIPFSYSAPNSYVDTNIKGTQNLLNAAMRCGVSRFIQTSTSEVYGTAQFVPITEDHPLVGQSPYSATKNGADQLALSYYRSFELPVTVIRPFNTYGPRQSARAIIPTTILQLAQGKKEIELGALHPTRDF